MGWTVSQLAGHIGAELAGDGTVEITSVGPVEAADRKTVTFITDGRHLKKLEKSPAGAVIVPTKLSAWAGPQLIVKDVDAAVIESLNIFAPRLKGIAKGIDPTAKVAQNARIAEDACIGPGVVIDDGVEVGANSVIGNGCKVGENSKVGKNY